jgi:DNA-binding NarL/FixJ family response regulator
VNQYARFLGTNRNPVPIYRLAGQGFSDADIANKLNITELKVQSCMAWLLRFLRLNYWGELVKYASSVV